MKLNLQKTVLANCHLCLFSVFLTTKLLLLRRQFYLFQYTLKLSESRNQKNIRGYTPEPCFEGKEG